VPSRRRPPSNPPSSAQDRLCRLLNVHLVAARTKPFDPLRTSELEVWEGTPEAPGMTSACDKPRKLTQIIDYCMGRV
jgi:hypothetical protein